MELRTENPPPAEGDPEPSEARAITAQYALLGDRVPSLLYVPAWSTWVCKGDIPPTQFASLQEYQDEFPLQVSVEQDCIVVTDPGFGKGAMEWIFRVFPLADGNYLAALTETDAHDENHECSIWIGKYVDDEWEDLTDNVLPSLSRADFFDSLADPRILEDFELVTLQYVLPRNGSSLHIQPMPNLALECVEGRVLLDDLDPADETLICEAWRHFRPEQITIALDAQTGKFLRRSSGAG
jgi:hypothetical protein